MKWVRSNIKQGTRLALFALAVQFVLSFGHFHAVAAQMPPAGHSGLTQSGVSVADVALAGSLSAWLSQSPQKPRPASDHDSDPNDPCAICAVIAMAHAVTFATPPVLLLPQAIKFVYLTADARFLDLNSASQAFQPRAPPIS